MNIITPNKKYANSANQKICLKFYRKQNRYIKYDANFTSILEYAEISPKILIGIIP
jgi:hypothetical protein